MAATVDKMRVACSFVVSCGRQRLCRVSARLALCPNIHIHLSADRVVVGGSPYASHLEALEFLNTKV